MSYRPPSHPPKTAWARHLDSALKERDWSRVRFFEEVGTELGYKPKSRSAVLPYLVDREPDETVAAVFRRHFGDPPAEPALIVTEPEPTLAAALSALAVELRESRRARETTEERLRALETELALLRRPAGGARREQSALPG